MLIGFWIAGRVTDAYADGAMHDWQAIWIYPAVFAAVVLVLFQLTFRNEVVSIRRPEDRADRLSSRHVAEQGPEA